jgi:hypothetical protein
MKTAKIVTNINPQEYIAIYLDISQMKNQHQFMLKAVRNFFPKAGQVM